MPRPPMASVNTLTSAGNPLLKDVRRAVRRGCLTQDGFCVAESFHLLEEALRSGCKIKVVLAAASARSAVEAGLGGRPDLRLAVVADPVFKGLSATESSQGVIALVRPPEWTLEQTFQDRPLVIVLDGLQDPGNAGAIVRATEAFGGTGLVFTKGTVNPFNPKAVRASAGSLFRVPLVHGLEPAGLLAALRRRKLAIYAASPASGLLAGKADLARSCAIIIGSEGQGISGDLLAGATALCIPTTGVESLNAAVAASILLYEASRQRTAAP
jgi:TrmH family RNA methyltransferase